MYDLDFSVAHIGINCGDVTEATRLLQTLFGLPTVEGRDSFFSGPLLEMMKAGGRGVHGHIGIGTDDIHAAKAYFEGKGLCFAADSAKYDDLGNMTIIYFELEIEGFALHLLQRLGK